MFPTTLYVWSHNRGTHLADADSIGEIRNNRGYLLSEARPFGERECTQPKHVPSWCEENKISEESTAEQFDAAIQAYINDVPGFTEKMLWIILAARHPICPGCCPGHLGLVVDLEIAGLLSE